MTRLLALLFLATTTVACIEPPPDDDDPDLAETSQAVMPQNYWWDQYQGHPVRMMSAADGFCVLTELTGAFAGRGELVAAQVSATDGYWYLDGSSQQSGVAASARCIPWWVFNSTNHQREDHYVDAPVVWGNSWSSTDLWSQNFDWFCPLSKFTGQLNGGGELARINIGWGRWTILQHSGVSYAANGLLSGYACINLGQTGNAVYRGGDPQNFGESSWTQGQAPVPLAPIANADCFLEGVTGRFAGGGEGVAIVDGGNGWWYLTGWSHQVDVGARARCIDHVQPGLAPPPTTTRPGGLF